MNLSQKQTILDILQKIQDTDVKGLLIDNLTESVKNIKNR